MEIIEDMSEFTEIDVPKKKTLRELVTENAVRKRNKISTEVTAELKKILKDKILNASDNGNIHVSFDVEEEMDVSTLQKIGDWQFRLRSGFKGSYLIEDGVKYLIDKVKNDPDFEGFNIKHERKGGCNRNSVTITIEITNPDVFRIIN